MKQRLDVAWNPLPDGSTGLLHSLPRSLDTALSAAGRPDPHIAAVTGFAFRIWVDGETLCPSAMSIWDFALIPSGLKQAGYDCTHISRMWEEDGVEQERREQAGEAIRRAIDAGMPAVAWNIGLPEWGLLIGYDDDAQSYDMLDALGNYGAMPYDQLGRGEIPILSVTIPGERRELSEEARCKAALTLAVDHARGREWCDNAYGLAAFPALAKAFRADIHQAGDTHSSWYYLGTYSDLRLCAARYMEHATRLFPQLSDAAAGYRRVHEALREAFTLLGSAPFPDRDVMERIAGLVERAGEEETRCVETMEAWLRVGASR